MPPGEQFPSRLECGSTSSINAREAASSSDPDSGPRTTITKTLFSADSVTSTSSSTSSSSTTSAFSSAASSDVSTIVSSSTSSQSQTPDTSTTSTSAPVPSPPTNQPAKIAGSVIGSMAAFGMVGLLLWYFCLKKQGKTKLKLALSVRRKNSKVKTPQVEEQSLERTRTIMLKQAEHSRSRESNINSFLTTSIEQHPSNEMAVSRLRSPIDPVKQSWIGMAVTSTTPPNSPPLPRSNSQRSDHPTTNTGQTPNGQTTHPSFVDRDSTRASLIPEPLKPGLRSTVQKPTPLVTAPQLAKQSNMSPLSPRAMFNVMSATTSRAWRRASKALSPSSYQRLDGSDRRQSDSSQFGRPSRRTSRNPDLDIGPQTDGGWNGQWL